MLKWSASYRKKLKQSAKENEKKSSVTDRIGRGICVQTRPNIHNIVTRV